MRATASHRPTLVAGSTWPADEAVLLPAWEAVRRDVPEARLIIAPHEPTAAHLEPLDGWVQRAGLSSARLSALESRVVAGSATGDEDVIVVDRVGVLGDLYGHAHVAFVGGGFHRAGLHSAIEPAAFGAPVLFGPGFGMSREAELLIAAGGARSVANAAECGTQIERWLADTVSRERAGVAAREIVARERGATDRSVQLVREAAASYRGRR